MNRARCIYGAMVAVVIGTSFGCGDETSKGSLGFTQQAVEAASLTVGAASFDASETLVASFSGFPGNPTDWVAIAPVGSPLTEYRRFVYVNGDTSGTVALALDGLAGSFVLRALSNNSFDLIVESEPFTVTIGALALLTDAESYTTGSPVVASYSALPGNQSDWIAVARAGAPVTEFDRWQYTAGQPSGDVSFDGLAAGTYVIRAFENNTFNLLGESASFTVADPTKTLTTDAPSYVTGTSVVVNYAHLPGYVHDWIAVAPQGSDLTTFTQWRYTNGLQSGAVTFDGLVPGTYVVRAFQNDSYVLLVESATFSVADPTKTVTTDASSYLTGSPVTATYDHLPGNRFDWIGVALAGSSATEFVKWQYTEGAKNGAAVFDNLPAGTYVVRAFENNSYNVLAESSSFKVDEPVKTVATDASNYSSASPIIVTYSYLPGNQHDWIALAPAGSDLQTFSRWQYTNGQKSGSTTFESVKPGTYVIRAFEDGGYKLLAESSSFAVSPAAASATPTAASYPAGATIDVTFANLSGSSHDWIAIAPLGAAPESYASWRYTYGLTTGTISLQGVPAGTYVVRVFFDDGYVVQSESSPISVE